MPKIKIKGKIKKFPYTKKGMEEAHEAMEEHGLVMNRRKKTNTYGLKNLKNG